MRPSFRAFAALAAPVVIAWSIPATAATPRETLLRAAFATPSKAQALTLVQQAVDQTNAILARAPNDKEARLQNSLAIGYRGQLKRSASDAKATRDLLIALVSAYPRDPEVQIAWAGWNLTAVSDLGGFLARTVLGANRATGIAALDRAVALGGAEHAFFPAYAVLALADLDPSNPRLALAYADRAASAPATTPLDRITQRAAARVAVPLRGGDGKAAAALAKQLLPFGTTN